jgi:small GTP-binding protein
MPELLSAEQARLRSELRAALTDLDAAIASVGATPEDRRLVADAIRGLDSLFLLVVVGEFNAGKSALLNTLLGARVLAEGVTPTTAAITLVRHGEQEAEEWRGEAFLERRLPNDALRDLAVVDTPGTNAILRRHEELTREFVPRADLVLFVTSADRPFTESERELLEQIRAWGTKVVVIVNKIDLLDSQAALDQVVDFVRQGLQSTLGFSPPLFAVSVRLNRVAAETPDLAARRALTEASRLDDLRSYVFGTLDEEERLRIKLAAPVGIAERLLERYGRQTDDRLATLADDLHLVDNVEGQIDVYAEDLRRAFGPRLAEIENVIHELNARGEKFFDETVRIGRVFDLLNTERTRGAFEREVVADTAERVDKLIDSTVDWFVGAEGRLWRQVSTSIRQRQVAMSGLGEDPDFIVARREVLQSVGDRARNALGAFDRDREAREIGQGMRDAVAQTALAEVGAVSLGAAIALLFGTVAADVTGLLAATLVASLGLYILPARKRRALDAFRTKTRELRERLIHALRGQLEREITTSTERVREAIAPYTRYVRAEGNRLHGQRDALSRLQDQFSQLRAVIESNGQETRDGV